MKNSKNWTVLLIVILALQAMAEALTVAVVLQLDMLPAKFVILLAMVMLLLVVIVGLLMFLRVKGDVSKARRIVACVLALLISVGCAVVSNFVSQAYDAVSNVTGSDVTTNARDMYILVRNDDPAQSISDTKGYVFAAIENYNTAYTDEVLNQVENALGQKPQIKYFGQGTLLADALYAKEADALIANGATVALLMEEEGYENFLDKARILHTFSYESLQPQEQTQPTETTVSVPKEITEAPFVVYVSGSDTRSKKLTVSRSDVNILMVINPVSKQVLLLNTPRDYFVPNPAGNGALDKLTHCGLYGVDCSMEALEDLYDTQIRYYGQINFTGFETLINAVGGVTIYSDQSFTARDTTIVKGENKLTGAQALDFARERYNVKGGDNGRGKNQMKVIKAVIDKMTSGSTIISKYSSIMDSLGGTFSTNMEMEQISKLVKMQLSDMATWNVQTFAVTGTGAHDKPYSQHGLTSYVMHPDKEMVSFASKLIDKVMDGEILTEDDLTVK